MKVDEKIGMQQRLIDNMCRYIFGLLLPLICLSAAASYLRWRRREVHYNSNFVCRAFVPDISLAGSSVVVFKLIVLTPVCQFHPLAASLCRCRHSREYMI